MRKFLLFSVLCGLMTTSANAGIACFALGPLGCLAELSGDDLVVFRSADRALFDALFPGVSFTGKLLGAGFSRGKSSAKGVSCVNHLGEKQKADSVMEASCGAGEPNVNPNALCNWKCEASGWVMYLTPDSCVKGYKPTQDNKKCELEGNKLCKKNDGSLAEVGEYDVFECTTNKNIVAYPLDSTDGVKLSQMCEVECMDNGWHMTLTQENCKTNYMLQENRKACIAADETEACTSRGGAYNAEGQCECPTDRGFKKFSKETQYKTCECAQQGFMYSYGDKKCVQEGSGDTIAQINQKKNSAAAAQKNKVNKDKCEASGGEWSNNKCKCDDTKSMKVSGVECTCIAGYKWKADKKMGCEMEDETRLQNACDAAPQGTTKWNVTNKRCECVNSNQTFDGTECKDNEDYAECKPLVASGVATWDAKREQKCMCIRQGYIIENGKCVETQDAKEARLAKEAEDKLKASRRKINDAHASLKSMVDSFKVSVWKDEDGKFNTARLASDSIAGVVLGTVGGVVTSSVVKKNQVENGFEDLKCTIGGQVVADWGDEFRVGIQ